MRTEPSPTPRSASNASKTSRVETGTAGVTSRTPGARAGRASGCDALAAALDEGRPADPEERHVRAELGRERAGARPDRARRPSLERAIEGRGGIRRPAGEPGGDRDPLLEAGRKRRRGPGPPGQPPPTAARAAASARNTTLSAGGPGSKPSTWRLSAWPPAWARLSRSARASGTKTECSSWKPSGRRPTTAEVRLSLAGASRTHGRQASERVRGGHHERGASRRARRSAPIGPSASRRASHSPTARVCGPPLGVDADRRRAPRSPARHRTAAGAPGRCGASCGARGSSPGRAARARPRSRDRGGRRRRTAPRR